MRISDWSSGVCSSDLNYQPTVSRSAATFILSPSGGMATIQKSAFRQLPVYPACHNQIINLDNRADHRNAQTSEQLSQNRAAQNTAHYAKKDMEDKLDHQDQYEQNK